MGKTSQNGDYTIYIKIKSLQKLTKVTWNQSLAYQITVEIHLLVQKITMVLGNSSFSLLHFLCPLTLKNQILYKNLKTKNTKF